MVARIPSCGRKLPTSFDEDRSLKPLWEWVTLEARDPNGEQASLSRDKPLICGQLTDGAELVLLCPDCLKLAGRKW